MQIFGFIIVLNYIRYIHLFQHALVRVRFCRAADSLRAQVKSSSCLWGLMQSPNLTMVCLGKYKGRRLSSKILNRICCNKFEHLSTRLKDFVSSILLMNSVSMDAGSNIWEYSIWKSSRSYSGAEKFIQVSLKSVELTQSDAILSIFGMLRM